MEEDTDDDLLDYEPSPACNGMEVNVLYFSSTDYSLLEEEEVSHWDHKTSSSRRQ
jgi:hypothetical protein